ncbi:DUF2735 domain-containing protein [Rhizobium puerariae]|uniref:DUF2735 domain-containing protein n=1 Tax=Rhizobium puerariae TaxID=1585791 RepID=A0ABV6AAW2_9HYPH
MATNIHRKTAQIIQFPVLPRRRPGTGKAVPAGNHEVAVTVVDTCWYHDEAVREGDSRPGDRPKPC